MKQTLTIALACLAAALGCTACFEKVRSSTDYVLKPLVQYSSGGLAEPLEGVTAYAFDADTTEWGVASYDDALAGIISSKENPAERIDTPLAASEPYDHEELTDRIWMSLPPRSLMLLAVDTQNRLYAYTQQTFVENLGSLFVSLIFKPWREVTAYQEKWSFYNPFFVPAKKLDCFIRTAAQLTDGGDEEPIANVKAYAFAADTTEWRIASYDDAVGGVLTSKLDPEVTRDTPEYNAYQTDDEELYRFVADRRQLMIVVIDRTHRRYAYVQQEVDLEGESPTFGVIFRLWQPGRINEENGWRIVNPDAAPDEATEND